MIAPLREPPANPVQQRRLRRARRLAADVLFPNRPPPPPPPPQVPRWQAWLLVAWMVMASASYLGLMIASFFNG